MLEWKLPERINIVLKNVWVQNDVVSFLLTIQRLITTYTKYDKRPSSQTVVSQTSYFTDCTLADFYRL